MTGASSGRLGLVALLAVALAAGCGRSETPTGAPVPTGVGAVNLVPPGGCVPSACVGTTLTGVQVVGPLVLAPFTLNFGITSILPYAPPGAYLVTGAAYQDSGNNAQGCPDARFTVAAGLTSTVTFAITNDVCTVAVAGPA